MKISTVKLKDSKNLCPLFKFLSEDGKVGEAYNDRTFSKGKEIE